MTVQNGLWLALWLLVVLWCGLYLWQYLQWWWARPAVESTPKGERTLKPSSPDQCDACRREAQAPTSAATPSPTVRPWSDYKSKRGRRKQINTEGYACDNSACLFFGICDARLHALCGDGSSSATQFIQSFRCGACGRTFSARRHTPLYRKKTPAERIAMVLAAMAEGLSIKAAVRVFDHAQGTLTTWLTQAGQHANTLHERHLHHLACPHLQLDELRTRLREGARELWLWLAHDPKTKLVPTLKLGPRTQQMAYALVHALVRTLTPECVPLFTTDGLDLYFYALTAHFGNWSKPPHARKPVWQVCADLIYGQVKKQVRRRKLLNTEPRMRCGSLAQLTTQLRRLGYTGTLNTAFVERLNLTVRQSVSFLLRRTWGLAQTLEGLSSRLEWWRAYYHFCRPHGSLRERLPQPIARGGRRLPQRWRQRTPAMAAGLTDHPWSVTELLLHPLPPLLSARPVFAALPPMTANRQSRKGIRALT